MNVPRSIQLIALAAVLTVATLAGGSASALAAPGPPPNRPNKRVCPGPLFGTAGCHALVVTDRAGKPLAGSGPSGYGPADFHAAYALPEEATTPQTIAIVDAYDDPTIESDLAVYSSTYGLPNCTTANGCFKKVNQSGDEGSYPKADGNWSLEIALDVETAHAICQNCEILLVEASTNSFADLTTAVGTAASLGATEISNSYGGAEYSGEVVDTAYKHPGVAVTASAGDNGYGAEYPAASPYVVAVGGTTLNLGSGGSYGSETVWSGSGSGCSAYVSAQSWQTADPKWALTGCGSKRGIADVAADANPSTGASIYDTTKYQGQSGWFTVGGTSLSAPLIASVYALAGGGAASYPAADPYSHQTDSPATLHDVTSGSNGSCGTIMCKGASGYDGPTGVGTPKGVAAFGEAAADTTAPQTTITVGPEGPTADPTPSFAFTSSEPGSTFECRVDAAPFTSCTSPYTAAALADGAHSFEVRATDAASNTDPTPAKREFSVDTAPPTSAAASPATTASTVIAVSYSAADTGSGLATVELWAKPPGAGSYARATTDSSPAATGSFAYSAAGGDGTYSFYTRATDEAGNYEAATGSPDATTKLDTQAPSTQITEHPATLLNTNEAEFAFGGEDGSGTGIASFQCRLDGGAWGACTSPRTYTELADGSHKFEVRAIDNAGNADAAPAVSEWVIDTVPPAVGIDSGPSGLTNDSMPAFTFHAGEEGAIVQCSIDKDTPSFGACTTTGSYTPESPLADGSWTFRVRSTDQAGNSATATRDFEVAPAAHQEAPPPSEPEPTPPVSPTSLPSELQTSPPFETEQTESTAASFTVGQIERGRRRNVVMLTVSVPEPGTLFLSGRKVRRVRRRAAAAGSVTLPVRPKARFMGRRGRGRTRIRVTYTAVGGPSTTKVLWIRLRPAKPRRRVHSSRRHWRLRGP